MAVRFRKALSVTERLLRIERVVRSPQETIGHNYSASLSQIVELPPAWCIRSAWWATITTLACCVCSPIGACPATTMTEVADVCGSAATDRGDSGGGAGRAPVSLTRRSTAARTSGVGSGGLAHAVGYPP